MDSSQPRVTRPDPLGIAVGATVELDRFVETAWGGLEYAEHAIKIVETLARSPYLRGGPREPAPAEKERPAKLEAFAADQRPHFSALHSLAAFRLWAILESAVEDFIRRLLEDDSFRHRPALLSIEGSLIEFASASLEEQCEILLARLKQRLGANLKVGVGRFESLLDAVGRGGPVDDLVRRVLLELSELRNVVAHKNGRADRRFLERCPWYGAREGEDLVVTHLHFHRYITAAHWYVVELDRRSAVLDLQQKEAEVLLRPVQPEELTEILERLVKRLAAMEAELGRPTNAPGSL